MTEQNYPPGHCLQIFSVLPTSTKSAIAQRDHCPHGDHASISRLLCGGRIDERTETGMVVVDKVDQILFDSMKPRRQALVLYHALELNPRQ